MKTLVSTLTLASAALAQLPPTNAMQMIRSTADSGNHGVFEACRVSGFDIPDVAYVRGSNAYLMIAPGWFQSVMQLNYNGTQVWDIRKVERPGDTDALLLLGDAGIGLWTYDATGGSYTSLDETWTSVSAIDVGDIEGDGSLDVLGIDGNTIHFANLDGGTAPASRVYSSSVLGACFAEQTNAVAGDELGIITASKIVIETATTGGEVYSYAPRSLLISAAHCAAAAIPSGRDVFVAAVSWSENPSTAIVSISPGEALYATDLQGNFPHGLTTADCTVDGYEDLVMAHPSGHFDLLFNHHLTAPSRAFQNVYTGGVRTIGDQLPAAGEAIRPAVADFDGDGDGDILAGYSAVDVPEVRIHTNGWIDINNKRPSVDIANSLHHGQLNIDVALTLPSTIYATQLEVLSWEVRGDTNLNPETLGERAGNGTLLPVSGPGSFVFDLDGDEGPVPSNNPHLTNGLGYLLVVRLIDDSAQPAIKHPGLVIAFSNNDHFWDMSNGAGAIQNGQAPESSSSTVTHVTLTPLPGEEPPECSDPPSSDPPSSGGD